VTATACVGTLVLEFVLLSRLTGDPKYEAAAVNALQALWNRRSTLNLVGNHVSRILFLPYKTTNTKKYRCRVAV
jgi:hypothetical protein